MQTRLKKSYTGLLSFNLALHTGEIVALNYAGINIGQAKEGISQEAFEKMSFLLSAGLFGSEGAKNNNFNPAATASNIMPKPEDFVDVPYRALSATIVGGGSWKASDFRDAEMLKAAVPLFHKKPLFTDHNQDADNWVGLMIDPYWQEATIKANGDKIPAGVNVTNRIDAKTNTKIARGVLMGALYASSVTVLFDWVPSHEFKTESEFMENLGSFGKDGQMVARKGTKINDVFENSLTWIGADPFAGKLDGQNLPDNIDKTSVYFSKPISYAKVEEKEKEKYEAKKKFEIDEVCFDKNIISLSKEGEENKNPTPAVKPKIQMKKFLLAFLAAFATDLKLSFKTVEGEDLTDAQTAELETAFKNLALTKPDDPNTVKILAFANGLKLANDKDEVAEFKPADADGEFVIVSKTQFEASKTAKVALTAQAAVGLQYTKDKRAEAVRLYKLAIPADKQDDAVVANIELAEGAVLDGMLKQYGGATAVKFGATCTKCGSSEHIDMRSSFQTGEIEEETTTGGRIISMNDIFQDKQQKGLFQRQ